MTNFILNYDPATDSDIVNFLHKVENKEDMEFSTSGTTGVPKTISHSYSVISKNIIIKPEFKNAVWGLTYPSSKIAGSQVILQAYLNNNSIVNLFNKPLNKVSELITYYDITHLSATPTFYRLLLDGSTTFNKIKQVTFGGEAVDSSLIKKVAKYFPNAKIKNIYASTEYGTLFASNKEYFEYSKKISKIVQLKNNKIFILKNHNWEDTGDIIEWIDSTKFKIIGREHNLINVGGYKVNPINVEAQINALDYVVNSKVYSKQNSILGNAIIADIIVNEDINKVAIKKDLKGKLESYEIPLKINIVKSLDITDTGKIIRR